MHPTPAPATASNALDIEWDMQSYEKVEKETNLTEFFQNGGGLL